MKISSTILIMLYCLILTSCISQQLRRQPDIHLQKNLNQIKGQSKKSSSSVLGWVLSPLLFIMSFILIWNNQRKAAIDHRRIGLAKQIVKNINPYDLNQIRQADRQLVHIEGQSKTNEPTVDSQTGITINGAIKIQRQVQVRELRQINRRQQMAWVSRNQQKLGDGASENDPRVWFLQSGSSSARRVAIGHYYLSQSLKQALDCTQIYFPNMRDARDIANRMRNRIRNEPIVNGEYIYFPTTVGSIDSLGTLRIKFRYCKTGPTSIISQSSNNTFVPYQIDVAQNGKEDEQNQTGKCCFISNCTANLFSPVQKIDFIYQNHSSAEEMLENQKQKIDCCKNAIRCLSFALMVFSICAFFSPITSIIGYVPLIGKYLSGAVALAIFLAAFIVCIPLFVLAVGICWVVFHPKVGMILLAMGLIGTCIVLAIIFTNKKQGAQEVKSVRHLSHMLKTFIICQP